MSNVGCRQQITVHSMYYYVYVYVYIYIYYIIYIYIHMCIDIQMFFWFQRNWHSCWNICVSGGFDMETFFLEHKFCRHFFSLKLKLLVGTVQTVCSLPEFLWCTFHQQHHAEYQQPTCAMQCSFHNVCSCMDSALAAEIDTEIYQLVASKSSRLCWPKFHLRLVGTVKLVCTLCEFWWWKVQLGYGYIVIYIYIYIYYWYCIYIVYIYSIYIVYIYIYI